MAIDLVQDSRDAEIAQLKQELEELKSRPLQAEATPQASTIETEEQENRDQVQIELDTAEEFVINSLFPNGIKVNSFVKTFLTMKGQTEVGLINDSITKFEQTIKPFMSPDGTLVLTGKPSELVRLMEPILVKLGKLIGG